MIITGQTCILKEVAYDALSNYAYGGQNNPLAHEVIEDMRRYYGLNQSQGLSNLLPKKQQKVDAVTSSAIADSPKLTTSVSTMLQKMILFKVQ